MRQITVDGVLRKALMSLEHRRHRRVLEKVVRHTGTIIAAGPFKGMKYLPQAYGYASASKLLGRYEAQLQEPLSELMALRPRVIVNVGCAEGYYAVGMALALPEGHVYAFDLDDRARVLCAELALLNGVSDRVSVLGECGPAQLAELPRDQQTVLVIDCEGAELDILRPDLVPALASACLLVELHDCMRPGVSRMMIDRFTGSHQLRFLERGMVNSAIPDWLDDLTPPERAIIDNARPAEQEWLVMTPLSLSLPRRTMDRSRQCDFARS